MNETIRLIFGSGVKSEFERASGPPPDFAGRLIERKLCDAVE